MRSDLTDALIEGTPLLLRTTRLTPEDADRAQQLCALRRYVAAARGYETHPGKQRPGLLQTKAHLLGALGELKAGTDLQHVVHLCSPLLDTRPERFDVEDAKLYDSDPVACLPVDIKTTSRDDGRFLVNADTAAKDEAHNLAGYLVLWVPKDIEPPRTLAHEVAAAWHFVPWDYFATHRTLHEKPDARGFTSRYYSCPYTARI